MSRVYVDNLNFYIDCLYLCIDTNSTKFKREISLRRLSCIFWTVELHNARSSVPIKNEEIKLPNYLNRSFHTSFRPSTRFVKKTF